MVGQRTEKSRLSGESVSESRGRLEQRQACAVIKSDMASESALFVSAEMWTCVCLLKTRTCPAACHAKLLLVLLVRASPCNGSFSMYRIVHAARLGRSLCSPTPRRNFDFHLYMYRAAFAALRYHSTITGLQINTRTTINNHNQTPSSRHCHLTADLTASSSPPLPTRPPTDPTPCTL